MKIVKEVIWWQFTCKACGCVCQADPEDVASRPHIDCDGDTLGYICIVECGKCGKEHDVPYRKVTEKIEKIASAKRRK